MNFKSVVSIVFISSLLMACNRVEVSENGLKYQFHENKEGKKGKIGDVVSFHFKLSTSADSVLRDTYKEGQPMQMLLQVPPFKGSFEEGLAMVSKGDSATFFVSADSLFNKAMQPLPPYIKKGSDLKFTVKVLNVQNEQEFQKEVLANKTKQLDTDKKIIAAFAAKNGLKPVATASGLNYIVKQAGAGENITAGSTVKVLYTGKTLDGKVFDSTEKQGGKPAEFQIGVGMVIPGWDEGILTMKKGGKSTFLIPSGLAYGEPGAPQGGIAPNSVLMFDVEVVDVKKGAAPAMPQR